MVMVVIVGAEGGKVAFERAYWDQASVLAQLGLLDPKGLPVAGAEQARRVMDRAAHPGRGNDLRS